ncbi:hypothetical protein MKY34_15085 [Sporosarcina sp. FSL K6-1522]|uniref:hypothetical protein n=1 Tax=Sporosarcina sp. FSL K6-1522 TaxID=2921554 RepID=UPI00315ABA99
MSEILDAQTCPYCNHAVEDHQSFWTEGEEDEVSCNRCNKIYISKPQYKFEGWKIEKQCDKCGEFTDDGYAMCDCGEYSESY